MSSSTPVSGDQAKALFGFARNQVNALAPQYIEQLKDVTKKATDGTWSQKTLSVAGGAYMGVVGILGILSDIFSLNAIEILLNVYVTLFGVIIVVLEAKGKLFSEERKQKIIFYFRALSFVWGRGIFFLFCSTTMFSVGGLLCWVGGAYMFALGAWMIYNGYHSSKRLNGLKTELRDDKAAAKLFHKFDEDKSGELDTREFAKLAKEMGIQLTHPMLESTILMLDQDRSGTISLKEFLDWAHKTNPMFTLPGEAPLGAGDSSVGKALNLV